MKIIHIALYFITICFSHTILTMNYHPNHVVIATIHQEINRICGDVDLRELKKNDLLDIINCIDQCYPGIAITKNLINALCARNSLFAYTIKYYILSAVYNYNNVTGDTLHIIENQQAQQPMFLLNDLPQPIREHVLLGAQHNGPKILLIPREEFNAVHLCNTAVNNTAKLKSLEKIKGSASYGTLKPNEKEMINIKIAKRNTALESAELEIKSICANKNALR